MGIIEEKQLLVNGRYARFLKESLWTKAGYFNLNNGK
jgi:hypothetical protein